MDAGEMFGKLLFTPTALRRGIFDEKVEDAVAFFESEFDRIREACIVGFSRDETINDGFDGVAFRFGDFEIVVKRFDFAIEADSDEAVLSDIFNDIHMLAFAAIDVGGENHDFEARRQRVNLAADGVGRLRMNDTTAMRAMRRADMRVQKS